MKKLYLSLLFLLGAMPSLASVPVFSEEQCDKIFETSKTAALDEQGAPLNKELRVRCNKRFITAPYVNGFVKGDVKVEKDDGSSFNVNLDNGTLDGDIRYYHMNGKLKVSCSYRQGKCVTDELQYTDEGRLSVERECVDGALNGFMRIYNEDGTVEEYTMTDRIKNGPSRYYAACGALISEDNYVNDQSVGPKKIFYPDGKIRTKITYDPEKQVENIIEYYENGKISCKYFAKDGRPAGPMEEYYESGRIYARSYLGDKAPGEMSQTRFYYDETPLLHLCLIAAISAFVISFILAYIYLKRRGRKKQSN